MLKVSGIHKAFVKGVPVLKNVSFRLEEGEILALIGESGCGKSTLLRILAGLETLDTGSIELKNEVLVSESVFKDPSKRNIGLVFQDFALFPNLTVFQNIKFGINKNSQLEINDIVSLVELDDHIKKYPAELSGGQQQRVALARALAGNPEVLLLDEPFSSIDENLKNSMRFELKKIVRKTKKTTILVSHDLNDALSIADKVIVLKKGQVEQIGTPQEVFNNPKSMYVAKFLGRFIDLPSVVFETNSTDATLNYGIRPNKINLDDSKEVKFEATIHDINFFGWYSEFILTLQDQSKISCFTTHDLGLSSGHKLVCSFNKKDLLKF